MKRILFAALALFCAPLFASEVATYPWGLNQGGFPDKDSRTIGFDTAQQVWGFSNSWVVFPASFPYIQDDTVCVYFAGGYNANQHWNTGSYSITFTRMGPPYFAAQPGVDLGITQGGATCVLTSNSQCGPYSSTDLNLVWGTTSGGNVCLKYHHS